MKRKILMTLMLAAMVLALGACGEQEKDSNVDESNSKTETQVPVDMQGKTENKEKQDNDEAEVNSVEVSLETLQSHAETSASDFEFSPDGDGLQLTKYLGSDVIVVLPEEVDGKKIISVSNNVFGEDSSVKAVRLSDSVENIAATFMNNENLLYVICGSSLKKVGDGAFNGCTSLVELQLNEGLESIGVAAIGACSSLKKLYIPETVTEMKGSSFGMLSEDFIIQGKSGSKAEEVANSRGYIFEIVE